MKRTVVIIIICAFILFSSVLAALCTGIYRIDSAVGASRELRDVYMYFASMIRSCEDLSSVRTASVGGEIPALVFRTGSDDNVSETWYFTYDGQLQKIRTDEGAAVSPEEGTGIMELQNCDFTFITDDLLEISFETQNGQSASVNICLTGREGAE